MPLKATIYKSTGNLYLAKTSLGEFVPCRIRGRLKIDRQISTTNPVAVGDRVLISEDRDPENIATILAIESRDNYMVRASINLSRQRHVIAANIDLAAIVVTVVQPFTSQIFLDRFLVTAEAYHIPALVVFNKADLYVGNALPAWQKRCDILNQIGYPTLTVSTYTKEGMALLKSALKNRTALLAGHSGVGKSSLINLLLPNRHLRIGSISEYNDEGRHTTTFAEMFDLDFGGKIIDTPGIKEMPLVDIEARELSHYFPEMALLINDCKFNNCLHDKEPGCAVKEAVSRQKISESRYRSYLSILNTLS